jgi:hypothetical protein
MLPFREIHRAAADPFSEGKSNLRIAFCKYDNPAPPWQILPLFETPRVKCAYRWRKRLTPPPDSLILLLSMKAPRILIGLLDCPSKLKPPSLRLQTTRSS